MDSGCFVSLQRKNLNNNKKIMDSGCLVSLLRKKNYAICLWYQLLNVKQVIVIWNEMDFVALEHQQWACYMPNVKYIWHIGPKIDQQL